MRDRRGRPGGEGPDRLLLLQAGEARQRRARHGAAAHRGRHAHRRQHRRRAATSNAPRTEARRRRRPWPSARPSINVMDEAPPQGGARPEARFRRGRAAAGLAARARAISSRTADLKAERTLRDELLAGAAGLRLPHGGKRRDRGRATREQRWIVDPLDGTTNFLHGIPHFAISIALERDGEIVAGVVYEPITRRDVLGREGHRRLSQRPSAARLGARASSRTR